MAATLLVIITLWTLAGTALALLIGPSIACADARRGRFAGTDAGAAEGEATPTAVSVPTPREPIVLTSPVGAEPR